MMKKMYCPLTIEDKILRLVKDWFEAELDGDFDARERSKALLKRFLVETDDGTFTLESSPVINGKETMHTIHGALLEARKKFLEPANLHGKEKVNILDLCSGLGYNTTVVLEALMDDAVDVKIDMVEVSLETISLALLIHSPLKSHKLIKKTIEKKLINDGYLIFEKEKLEIPSNIDIKIHCKDAREFIKSIKPHEHELYDAVFLDPFSPGKTPELYSLEFFQGLSGLIKKEGLILTYTSAAPVRSALLEAGFQVGEGPTLKRRGGTMASPSITMITKSLSKDDERMIALSDVGIPFKDPKLDNLAEDIFERRESERKTARGYYKLASTVKTPVYLNKVIRNHRLKKRVLEHLGQLGIMGLDSPISRYLVCPQFSECICNCGQGKYKGSKNRINEMCKRLNDVVKGENFGFRNKI